MPGIAVRAGGIDDLRAVGDAHLRRRADIA